MKFFAFTAFFIVIFQMQITAQKTTPSDFHWGNGFFYNLIKGQSILFNDTEIQLINIEGQYNRLKIDADTFDLKVVNHSLPFTANGFKIYIADNRNIQTVVGNPWIHGLLTGDALICICPLGVPLLEASSYVFPVSFKDGFIWSGDENSSMFTFPYADEGKLKEMLYSHEGIDFDLNDARGIDKHPTVAIENSSVIWVENKSSDAGDKEACVLLRSDSNPKIYYIYQHLYNRMLKVKKGDRITVGDVIGSVWGDEKWSHLHFSVIYSDTIPSYQNRFHNVVNIYPQIYELYFKQTFPVNKTFTKGRLIFGKPKNINRNSKNNDVYDECSGKGWILDNWNITGKVDWIVKGNEGNVRLQKRMFGGTKAACTNPLNYYEYEISCPNGVYRIRANMGDLTMSTWQKVDFEGINAATYSLKPGETKWTHERAVKVKDNKLTIRIYIDDKNELPAGISEIVFQQAY